MSFRNGHRWLQKPPPGTRLDPSHPWSAGLLVALVQVDGLAAGALADLVGNVWTPHASPTVVAGRSGEALRFASASSQYLSTPDRPGLKPTRITIAAGVKPASAPDDLYIINHNYDGSSVPFSLNLGPNSLASRATAGMAFFNGTWRQSGVTTQVATDGKWHDVAGTYNGATLAYYIDGRLDSSSSYVGSLPTTNTLALDLGRYGAGASYFNGQIDYLYIWDHAKSQSFLCEVAAEPWQPFRGPSVRRFFVPSGGGPPPAAANFVGGLGVPGQFPSNWVS